MQRARSSDRKRRPSRRHRPAAGDGQYSLFSARPIAGPANARHFQRQAELCERLITALHQPELVEALGRLHDEFEAAASGIATPPRGGAEER